VVFPIATAGGTLLARQLLGLPVSDTSRAQVGPHAIP
jgi:hypothetical protein